ncbi:MAG: VOC family protein [Pyrinomonadaceae bacterium]
MERKVMHTRHVLAVKDLAVEADYYRNKLGFDHDFSVPGWEFLSFGIFKVMLGHCVDAMWAHETGDHSYCSYAFVEDVDEIYREFTENGANMSAPPQNKPWGLREFMVKTPSGHRIMFGQEIS